MYDFTTLSPYDFEDLVRDILQKELEVRFGVFKKGKDKGVDLRFSASVKTNEIIVQCKHYAGSGFPALLSKLKSEELSKVKKLAPSRYILATSVSLSETNKVEIVKLFSPYILGIEDVWGQGDLNNSLKRYPEIETQNFKLWLSSSNVLGRIVHSEVFNRTKIDLEQIRKKIRLYVQGDAIPEATKILEGHRYCIISGIPGIGKTTLAEMLLLHYLAKDFEAVKILGSISDAYKLFTPDKKQIFYYDDFLGKTHLGDQLGKNEDDDLIKFIEKIQNSPLHRFVLTTREYILKQAIFKYERLASANFDYSKYVLNLEKYARIDRAKILINHLYFSDISNDHLSTIFEGKRYQQIINHKNFSPRIVERMTIYVKQHCANPNEYFEKFKETLDNPEQLWKHAFESQISDAGRAILLCLSTLPGEVHLEDLEKAFNKFYSSLAEQFKWKRSPRDFLQALKEVDGTFLTTANSHWGRTARFHNPSINDFLENYLKKNSVISLLLANSLCFFDQLEKLSGVLLEAKNDYGKYVVLEPNKENLDGFLSLVEESKVSKSAQYYRYTSFEDSLLFLLKNKSPFLSQIIQATYHSFVARLSERIESGLSSRDGLTKCLLQIKEDGKTGKEELDKILEMSAAFLKSDLDQYEYFDHLVTFNSYFEEYVGKEGLAPFANDFATVLEAQLDDLMGEYNDPQELNNFIDDLKGLALYFDLDVDHEVGLVKEKVDELEREMLKAEEHREDYYRQGVSTVSASTSTEDAEIERLFDSIDGSKKS